MQLTDGAAEDATWRAADAGDAAFFAALTEEQLERARELRDEDGRTALHVAAAGGHASAVEALLRGSSNPPSHVNVCDEEGWTPLMSASSSGRLTVVHSLLQHGADAAAVNSGGRTALHYAASKGHVGILRQIVGGVGRGARAINQRDKVGATPLHRAAAANQPSACELLLEEGAAVDAADASGQTPAMAAALCAHEQVVLLLVRHGASIDKKDKEERTVLSLCFSKELKEAVVRAVEALREEEREGRRARKDVEGKGAAGMEVDH